MKFTPSSTARRTHRLRHVAVRRLTPDAVAGDPHRAEAEAVDREVAADVDGAGRPASRGRNSDMIPTLPGRSRPSAGARRCRPYHRPMPKAYWINMFTAIHDEDRLASYARLAGPAMEAAGGRFLARGTPAAAFEGGSHPARDADRVSQRRGGRRRVREPGVPGGAAGARRRRRAGHPDHRGRGLTGAGRRSAVDELLAAVDVVGRAGERGVGS